MAARKIIIDAAPGQDDAIGLLMALAGHEDLEVVGICVVGSRVPIDIGLHNARRICEVAGRHDIRIYAGCGRPMRRPPIDLQRPDVDVGLDGYDAPAPKVAIRSEHAVDFLISTFREAEEGSITLCCLGPLTNIATALEKAPDMASRIGAIVMMAGSNFELGDVTPVAETNAWIDPDAMQVVLRSGVTCITMPLDVAHKVIATPVRLSDLRAIGTYPAEAAAAWADVVSRLYVQTFGANGMPLHSACVIAFMLRPYLFTGRQVNIEIETESDLTRGMSVVDWWGITTRPPNALFMSDVDADGLFALLNERIAMY